MTRNPLDNILSIFLTDINYANDYIDSDLDWIYNYFKFYKEIIEEFKVKYPNNIYDCKYDNIVNDPEKYIKELINYVGFEWSDKYLNFNKSNITVTTASVHQVRQKIYKSSSRRWINYREQLKGIISKLEEDNTITYSKYKIFIFTMFNQVRTCDLSRVKRT